MDNLQPDQHITSMQNPRVKLAVKLRDRRQRDKENLFLIEGYRELSRAVAGDWTIDQVFYCPKLFLGTNEPALLKQLQQNGVLLCEVDPEPFRKISYRDRPDGLLAIAPQPTVTLGSLVVPTDRAPFFVVAEAIEKPGNLGTILRSADAAGADGLIVCDKCTDLFNPNVVRASVGTLFTVPIAEASSEEALAWLKGHNVQTLAATPSAVESYSDVDMKQPVAIVVGTEQLGLSDQWMSSADMQVRLPMCGVADSLNVATATTILLYEVLRQRGVK